MNISLFQEEISACTAVHTCYVMDACNQVRSIILLPCMMGTSFLLVGLKRLIVSESKHTQNKVHFPFLRGREGARIPYFSVSA